MFDVIRCKRRVTTGKNGEDDAADFAGFWLRYQRISTLLSNPFSAHADLAA
jgi:hypothetical protein